MKTIRTDNSTRNFIDKNCETRTKLQSPKNGCVTKRNRRNETGESDRRFSTHLRNIFHQCIAYLLILLFILQSGLTVAASTQAKENAALKTSTAARGEIIGGANSSVPPESDSKNNSTWITAGSLFKQAFSFFENRSIGALAENNSFLMTPAPPEPANAITGATISRHRPSLNGGRIEGSLRVFAGESYTVNSQFQLAGDLYTVGTPNVTVNSGASHGGIIGEGGNAQPSGYGITLNSGAVLPGEIRIRADAPALPTDIPTSVPNPSGNRSVNINSPSDLNNIGNWTTVRDLNVSPSNQVISVPPGNYGTFTMNGGNIRLVFSAGTYNFSGTINLNNASSVQSNGAVTINIGQGLNINNGSYVLGANTSASDVKLNVVGSSLTIDNGSQISALVRAVNANVNFNNGILRGQIIANYLNINNGQIIAATVPADTTPPTLSISSPANNSTTQAATVNVTGTG